MPVFEITSPDGQKYRVTAPEGATREDAIAYVQSGNAQSIELEKKELSSETPLTRLPKEGMAGIARRLGSAAQMGFQGVTGGFGEEIRSAGAAPIISGLSYLMPSARDVSIPEAYDIAYAKTRGETETSRSDYPIQSVLSEIGGAIPTTLAIGATKPAMALANWASSGGTAAKAAKSYAAAVPAAATYLAADAKGGMDSRLSEAAKAPIYAFAAPALSIVGSAVKGLISKSEQAIAKKVLSREMEKGTGLSEVSDSAAEKVIARLKADFPNPEDFTKAMNDFVYGKKSLAEIGGARTENLARGAAQFPTGEAAAREFIDPRISEVPNKMTSAVKKFISNKYNYQDTIDDIVAKGREKASPIYREVSTANQSMTSPRLDNILNTPAGRDALKTVATHYQNQSKLLAKPDPELTKIAKELADLDMMAETRGGVSGGLRFDALNAIKIELDSKVRAAKRAVDMGQGGSSEAYRGYEAARSALVDELDRLDKTGLYKKAREVAGDYITAEKAAELGTKFRTMDYQDTQRLMSGYSKSERDAFRVGMVKQLRKEIETYARDASMSNANIYSKILGDKWKKNQVEAAIGSKNFEALEKELDSVKRIYQLKQSVLGNSTTAGKQIAAQEFDDAGQGIINQVVQNGGDWKSVAIDKVQGMINRKFSGLSDKTAGDVAKILYETDPKEKIKIFNRLKLSNIPEDEKNRALKAYFTIEGKTKTITK